MQDPLWNTQLLVVVRHGAGNGGGSQGEHVLKLRHINLVKDTFVRYNVECDFRVTENVFLKLSDLCNGLSNVRFAVRHELFLSIEIGGSFAAVRIRYSCVKLAHHCFSFTQ